VGLELKDQVVTYLLQNLKEQLGDDVPIIVIVPEPDQRLESGFMNVGVTDFINRNECTPSLFRLSVLHGLIHNQYATSDQNYEQALLLLKHKAVVELSVCEERQKLEDANVRLHYMSMHDTLTKLPNRTMLLEHLQRSLLLAKRNACKLAVLHIDLDKFKNVNDSLGHDVGDQVLLVAVNRIKSQVRESDILSRIGGDEFVLLVEKIQTAEEVKQISRKLIEVFDSPIVLDREEIYMSTSIGIDILSESNQSAESLLKRADIAMCQAKTNGGNDAVVFSQDLNHRSLSQLSLTQKLHRAIKNNELQLFYQPKVNAETYQVEGAEGLLRWVHSSDSLSPDVFIPVAEESDLILEIGQLVIEQACAQIARWQKTSLASLSISVNISSRQFIKNRVTDICRNSINQHNINPSQLELEVTERTVFESVSSNRSDFAILKDLGITISIDDFGTGYSSLNYLKQFPFDIIKIDGSFVHDLPSNRFSTAIISGILHMTKNLNLKSIAEGVENRSQFEELRLLGCESVQGFYFSRPLPVVEFEKWVDQHQELAAYRNDIHTHLNTIDPLRMQPDMLH
jgi:diguanylate cyclase (GGDEF)-like protein